MTPFAVALVSPPALSALRTAPPKKAMSLYFAIVINILICLGYSLEGGRVAFSVAWQNGNAGMPMS